MYELWRIQKWKNYKTVKYRIFKINNIYIPNIKQLDIAQHYLEQYHIYLNNISKETDLIMYSDIDYILIYKNNKIVYRKYLNINNKQYNNNKFDLNILLYIFKIYILIRFFY